VEEQVRLAREEVVRIQRIGSDVDAAARSVKNLSRTVEEAEQALKVAEAQHTEAAAAFEAAEEAIRVAGSDPAMEGPTQTLHMMTNKNAIRSGCAPNIT
jgi:hypothetical protein